MKKNFWIILSFALIILLVGSFFSLNSNNEIKSVYAVEGYVPTDTMDNIFSEYYNFGYWDGANPSTGYYPISTYDDLLDLSYLIINGADIHDSVFYLTNDIDFSGITHEPIGAEGYHFNAIFDGCGYTISNFSISNTTNSAYGLFGYIGENGLVKNLNLTNVNITQQINSGRMGAIAAYNMGTIDRCSVTNSTISSNRSSVIGSLVSSNESGTINNSFASSVNIDGSNANGIAYAGTINSCFTYNIQDAGTYTGSLYLIGANSNISNSYYYSTARGNWDGIPESTIYDFTSGKVCGMLNNAFRYSGLNIFGQEIGIDEFPTFLTSSNITNKLTIPVHFQYDGEIFDTLVANENGSVLSLPTPIDKEEGTCLYSVGETPFTLSTVISEETTVQVSGGTPKAISTYWFNSASGTGSSDDPFVISTKEDLEMFRLACDSDETISSGESFGFPAVYSNVSLANNIVLNDMVTNELGDVMSYLYESNTYYFQPSTLNWYISSNTSSNLTDSSLLAALSSLVYSWNPIDYFKGAFDGKGFEIEGLYIKNTGTSNSGLFSYLGGTVSNLSISGYIQVAQVAGGISGTLGDNGSITNCINRATISTTSGTAGGIVGSLELGTIDSCINYGSVTGSNLIGGIVGNHSIYSEKYSKILNSINYGNISASISYAGGILGRAYYGLSFEIVNNINYGSVNATNSYAGGIIGIIYNNYDSFVLFNNVNFNIVNSSLYEGGIVGGINEYNIVVRHNYWKAGSCDNELGYGSISSGATYEYNYNFSEVEDYLSFSEAIDINGDLVTSYYLVDALNEYSTMYPNCKSWEQTVNLSLIYSDDPYYTLTYDANYDSNYENGIVYTPSLTTIIDMGYLRDSYSFAGWSLEANDLVEDEAFSIGNVCAIAANITLYAIWERDYEVKYLSILGGLNQEYNQYISKDAIDFTVLENDQIDIWPPNDLFEFIGWNTDPDATEGDPNYLVGGTAEVTDGIILYAIWRLYPTDTLEGAGTQSDPFLISSLYDLETLAIWTNDGYYVNDSYFLQTSDIEMNHFEIVDGTPYVVYEYNEYTYYYNFFMGEFFDPLDLVNPLVLAPETFDGIWSTTYFWHPIGGVEINSFSGNYNGNGHCIRGMISDPSEYYFGLFGQTEYSIISNLLLENGLIFFNEEVGAIVSNAFSTTIINCAVENVFFYGTEFTESYAGGLVSSLQNSSSIINSYVSTTIFIDDNEYSYNFGGLVNNLDYSSSLINSYSNIDIVDESGLYNDLYGIAGYFDLSDAGYDYTPIIIDCYYYIGDASSYSPLPFSNVLSEFSEIRVNNVFFFDTHHEEIPDFPETPPESGFWVIEILGEDNVIFTDLAEILNSFSTSYSDASNWFIYDAPTSTPSLECFFDVIFYDSADNEATGILVGDSDTISIQKRNPLGDVYYTLDGSDPTIELASLYSSPLIVTDGTTLKAVEYYNGQYGVVSSIVFKRALTIFYDISSASSGLAPTDSDYYVEGNIVSLDRGYDLIGPSETPVFSGWALSPSLTEGTYTCLINAPLTGNTVTFYPVWKAIASALSSWDGVSFDVDWYFNNPSASTFNISTAAEFAGIHYLVDILQVTDFEDQTINLLSDINLSMREWPSIGYDGTFSGTFDGNFHIIYNLYISENNPWYSSVDYTGLFSFIYDNAIIQNLGLSGGYVYGDNVAATLVSSIDNNSIVRNCWVEGVEVEAINEYSIVGGIAAYINYSSIINCYSTAQLFVGYNGYAGGIVGQAYLDDYAYIYNCYFAGKIEKEGIAYIGAIIGDCETNLPLITAPASSLYYEENKYPLCGFSALLPNSIPDSSTYYFGEDSLELTNSVDPNGDNTPTSSLLFALNEGASEGYFPWNNALWVEDSFGILRHNPLEYALERPIIWTDESIISLDWYYTNLFDEVFYISTAEELGGLAYVVNEMEVCFSGKTIYLTNDLDMSGALWQPIGNDYIHSTYFCGTFDGRGHSVSNLNTPSWLNEYAAGMFGAVSSGTILNLGIINGSFYGASTAGGIAGILGGNIYNCYATGTVFARTYAGGIVGGFDYSSEGGIINNWTLVELSGLPGCTIGNIAGYSYESDERIVYCYYVVNNNYPPVGIERNSQPSYSNCMPFTIVDGEYLLTNPVDNDGDLNESAILIEVLNEVVRMYTPGVYAKYDTDLSGNPIYDGFYQTYDVIADFSHMYLEYGNTGRAVAAEGLDYTIGLAASTGYTLNGALPSVFVGGVQIESSCYSWDTSSSILTIYSQYITDHITIYFEALPALISISKAPTLNGSFEVNANALFRSTVEISVMPNEGYEISAVNYQEQSGALLAANYNIITGKYEFVMPGRATIVAVTFSPIVYTISLFNEGGIALHGYYETDKSVATITDVIQVRPHPDSGYEVDSVTYIINSIEKNALIDEGYWIEDITGDVVVKVTFKIRHYNVVLDSTYTGGGEFYASSSIAASGATVYVSLSPDPGYEALNENIYYSYGGHNYSMTLYSGYYYRSFTMPASDVTVYVIFTEADYSITKQATSNGSYTVVNGDDQEIEVANYSEIIYVVPTPNAGYEIDSVRYYTTGYVDVPYYDLKYSISMPNYPVQIYVTFKKVVYDITANATTNGSYTLSKTSAYYGDTITVTPIPAPGYDIDSVSYNDGSSHDITPVLDVYPFDMPASDISISVSFYPISPVITATESDNGSFTVTNSTSDPVTSMPYTELVIITPTPDSGYQVDKVYYYANSVGVIYIPNISGYSFEMPAFDITVYVTFISTSANIIVNTPTGGWVKVTSDSSGANIIDTADPEATVYITYYLSPGYLLETQHFTILNESNGAVGYSFSSGSTYSFAMPSSGEGVTITLNTVLASKTISYFDVDGYAEHGSYSALSETVNVGSAVEISATPEDGYYISSISYNDGTDTVYLPSLGFIMPNSDVTLKVTFAPITYYVTKGTSSNGTFDVTPSSTTVGEEITVYLFVPDKGYEVNSVSYNDGVDDYGVYPVLGSYYFDMPAADVVVTVVFTKIDYSISKAATSNGSFLTTDGSIEIDQANYMDEVIIALFPNTGYELDVMYYNDGTSNNYVTYNSGYRFSMPAANTTVYVSFKMINYFITKTPTEGGTILVDDADLVSQYNTGITLTVTPLSGFKIDHVYYTNKATSIQTELYYVVTPGNYIFSMPAADVSVEATFSRQEYEITTSTVGLGNYEMWDGDGVNETGLATFGYNTYVVLDSDSPSLGYRFLSVQITKDSDSSVILYTYLYDSEFDLHKYQFLMPDSDITVTVTFVEENYLVSFAALSNGLAKIYRDGQAEVNYLDDIKYNEQIAISVYPNIGYEIASVSAYYESTSHLISDPELDGIYLLTMPADNVVLTVTFDAVDYIVTLPPDSNGDVEIELSSSLLDAHVGDKVSLFITPDDYYMISEVSYSYGVTTVIVSPVDGIFSFNMPASDVDISISYEKIQYTITYVAVGAVAPEAVSYDYETSLTIAAGLTRTGYIFAGWKVTTASGSWMLNQIYGSSEFVGTMNGNVTITAQWEAIQYTLLINGQTIIYTIEDEIEIPDAIPAPFGYEFSGWEVYGSPTGNWVPGEIAQALKVYSSGEKYGDANFSAKNTALTYTLTYDVQDGIEIPEKTYYSSNILKIHGEAYRDGYTFVGWKVTSQDGNWVIGELYSANYQFSSIGIYGNVTLQAQWSIITYTITIYEDTDSDPEIIDSLQYTIESGFTLSTGTPRNGYFLDYYQVTWEQSNWASLNDELEPGVYAIGFFGNANLRERWEKTQYTITFDTNGGSIIAPANYSIGNYLSIVASPEKFGYELLFWGVTTPGGSWILSYQYSPSFQLETGHEMYGNVTLTANWATAEYTIDYNDIVPDGIFLHNQTITFAIGPSYPGHTFLYWKVTSMEQGANWVLEAQFDSQAETSGKYGSIQVEGVWSTNSVNVVYNLGTKGTATTLGDDTVLYDAKITTLPTLSLISRDGYSTIFVGWFSAETEGFEITTDTTINATNITSLATDDSTLSLYARYSESAIVYTVSYNNVNGLTNDNPTSYIITDDATLSSVAKTGYTFDGWYDNEGLSGTAIASLGNGAFGNVSLFAKFAPISYTISYQTNGGSATNNTTYTIEDSITLASAPIKAQYRFTGWELVTSDGNISQETFAAAEVIPSGKYGDITLQATWATLNITLSGNIPSDTITFNANGTITITNPTREGYTFEGWYLDEGCTQFFNPETDILASDTVLYPKWTLASTSSTLSGGAIAGIVVGSVGFVAIGGFVALTLILKKQGKSIKSLFQKKPSKLDKLTAEKPAETSTPSEPIEPPKE